MCTYIIYNISLLCTTIRIYSSSCMLVPQHNIISIYASPLFSLWLDEHGPARRETAGFPCVRPSPHPHGEIVHSSTFQARLIQQNCTPVLLQLYNDINQGRNHHHHHRSVLTYSRYFPYVPQGSQGYPNKEPPKPHTRTPIYFCTSKKSCG